MRRSNLTSAALTLALGLVAVTGCAAEPEEPESSPTANGTPTATGSPTETGSPSETPTTDDQLVVDITIIGEQVRPNGASVEVGVGEPVVLAIEADAAGELHLHSTPEQEIAYPRGASEHEVTFDRPGVVEVESHDLGKVIVQLEVR